MGGREERRRLLIGLHTDKSKTTQKLETTEGRDQEFEMYGGILSFGVRGSPSLCHRIVISIHNATLESSTQ